jgi:ADP-heptose:LPS heptosyltransferase
MVRGALPEGIAVRPLVAVPPGLSRDAPGLLAIRFSAFGDATIALAALASVRRRHAGLRIEVVTDPRQAPLFAAHRAIDRVWTFDSRAPRHRRARALLPLVAELRRSRPIAVADLQRCRWSRLLSAGAGGAATVAWDRFAPIPALVRALEALEALGLGPLEPVLAPDWRAAHVEAAARLVATHVPDARPMIALNPAAAWPTRYWPMERWCSLAARLEARGVRIVLLQGSTAARVRELASRLPTAWLVAEDAPVAAALVSRLAGIVSEDSGLMHLAWTQGVPTVALFGATRAAWTAPHPSVGFTFGSEDLPCGACMRDRCARGDVFCLDRVSVDEVLGKVDEVMGRPASGAPGAITTRRRG